MINSTFSAAARLDDDEAQAGALTLLKVPTGVGYEATIAQLGQQHAATIDGDPQRDRAPRQFLFADGAGGVERIRIDSGPHLAHLRAALDTTPGQATTAAPPAIQADGASRPVRGDDGESQPIASTGSRLGIAGGGAR